MKNENVKFKINFSLLIFNLTEPDRAKEYASQSSNCKIQKEAKI